jgi:hypothetical protein
MKTIQHSSLEWSTEDVDLRMNSLDIDESKFTTDAKLNMLYDFFDSESDLIMEFINQRLENYLFENITQN